VALVKKLRDQTGAPIGQCKDAISAVSTHSAFVTRGLVSASSHDGVVDAYQAMSQSHGSDDALLQAAADVLRKKGIAAAGKKAGRSTSEGLIAMLLQAQVLSVLYIPVPSHHLILKNTCCKQDGTVVKDKPAAARAVIAEVNCETDFVARNTMFQTLVSQILLTAAKAPATGNGEARLR